MRFIENPDLREWVKESLQRAVFQKAHELAVQTGCEVLVKFQDTADHSGQYYATRTLHLQYQGKGLSKQPWEVKVSGVTGLPEIVLVEKGCQSDGEMTRGGGALKDEEVLMMTETDSVLLEQETDLVASAVDNQRSQSRTEIYSTDSSGAHQTSGEERLSGTLITDVKVEEQDLASYRESFQSSNQPVYSDMERGQIPARRGDSIQPTSEECEPAEWCAANEQRTDTFRDSSDHDGALPTVFPLHTAAAYPIGFPINKLQALTKSVDDRIQTPFPSQVLADLEGSPPNPPERGQGTDDADNAVALPTLKPYQCGICLESFESVQILSCHAQMNHGMDRRMSFLCDVCGQSYKQAQHLQRHMRMHRVVMPYVCSVCSKGFSNATRLMKHEKAHEQLNERHKCRACFKFFSQIVDLQKHFKQVHGGPGIKSSDQSSGRFIQSEMPSSEAIVEPTPEEGEGILDRTTTQSTNCEQFLQTMPSQPGPSTMRPIFPQNVAQHMTTCQSDSSSPSSAEEQRRDKEGSPQMSWQDMTSSMGDLDSTPTSSAVSMPEGIRQPSSLARNIGLFSARTQSSGLLKFNRHVCDICGKSYKYNFTLREHLLTHSSVPQFVCKICGKAFTRQRLLRDHMFRHSGTYPYHCELCGKGFIRPSTMKRHQTDRHRMLHDVAD